MKATTNYCALNRPAPAKPSGITSDEWGLILQQLCTIQQRQYTDCADNPIAGLSYSCAVRPLVRLRGGEGVHD